MGDPPLRVGEFVWTRFPEGERPLSPGPRHSAYVLHVAALGDGGLAAVVAYTTSTGLDFRGRQPRGVHAFDAMQASALGHRVAFRLDLKRLAYLPITPRWFPDLEAAGRGVQGRAPRTLRAALQRSLDELLLQHRDVVSFLGPLWNGG